MVVSAFMLGLGLARTKDAACIGNATEKHSSYFAGTTGKISAEGCSAS
jgi:hypothetical protein